jgi:hypothetical protein
MRKPNPPASTSPQAQGGNPSQRRTRDCKGADRRHDGFARDDGDERRRGMGWLVSSGVSQLPFCPSCSQATIILPNDKAVENPEMFEIGRSNCQLYR